MSFINFNDVAKNKRQVITIQHVATSLTIEFPAFLKEFSDNYQVSWGNEQIFGRNDPVKPYQATTREIQIGFSVLAPDMKTAKENLEKFSKLSQMLYPSYSEPLDGSGGSVGRTITAPPLIRLKFVNLVQSANGGGTLLGCIEGAQFSPNQEAGFFVGQGGEIFPKHYDLSFRFTPQHEDTLGWDLKSNSFITDTFPYNTQSDSNREISSQGNQSNLENANNDRALS